MQKPPPPPSRSAEQFVVRLPDGMRERIKEASDESGRSMNAEIVHRLQASFEAPSNSVSVPDAAATLSVVAHLQYEVEDQRLKNHQARLQLAEMAFALRLAVHHIPDQAFRDDPSLLEEAQSWTEYIREFGGNPESLLDESSARMEAVKKTFERYLAAASRLDRAKEIFPAKQAVDESDPPIKPKRILRTRPGSVNEVKLVGTIGAPDDGKTSAIADKLVLVRNLLNEPVPSTPTLKRIPRKAPTKSAVTATKTAPKQGKLFKPKNK